jgi:bifunctional UDP-N-acetylglucosamine pyrophosphorylase/glucosamine-1-phosphate N-acetyltransferase
MKDWIGIVLAAGNGVRMRSKLPKPLHKVCGKPMVTYPVETLRKTGLDDIVVVCGERSENGIKAIFQNSVRYVKQRDALGTGHAVLQCSPQAENMGLNVIVMVGDAPLIDYGTIQSLMDIHITSKSTLTILTATESIRQDMGRIERNSAGMIQRIVEASDDSTASPVKEVNSGVYCLNANWMWQALRKLVPKQDKEYYLTELVNMAVSDNKKVESFILTDSTQVMGINDRVQLSVVEGIFRQNIREYWMMKGVTIIDPASTFIDASVIVDQDTTIHPNSSILGQTEIGQGSILGPGITITDSIIGQRCTIVSSVIESSTLEADISVGPFSHLRPGTYLEARVHIGNFAEIKASRLGKGVKMGHFGFLGDATVGSNTNLGAGMITCNFDGVSKHKTEIGDNAFIGSDTMLVAPIKIGDNASTGAGSVVTKDVPAYRLAKGIPAKITERSK